MARCISLSVSSLSNSFVSRVCSSSSSSSSFPTKLRKFTLQFTNHRSLSTSCCCSQGQNGQFDISTFKEAFARRMAMTGLKPHHRIALGVSGGPDSMALCILASSWKRSGGDNVAEHGTGFIDGLLAIVVDHGLRADSKEEAYLVSRRVLDMGFM